MEIFIFWFIFAIIVAVWAGNWGRSGFGYFLLSVILSPLLSAIILLVSGKKDGGVDMVKCPDCAEYIKVEAIKCRYCGRKFKKEDSITVPENQEANWKAGVIIIVIGLLFGIFFYYANSIKI